MSQKLIGIDLGGTSIKFGILTLAGEIQDKWAIETNILDQGSRIIPSIIQSIQHRMELYKLDKTDILGVGMGSPGSVNRELGTVTGAYNLGWKSTQEVGQMISSQLGLNFAVDNDANVAALGERWQGAGDNQEDVVFITLGTGVGGGVIAGGQLIHGIGGSAGEIGHLIVQPEGGFECTCGSYGCLETVASATGIVRLAHKLAEGYEGDSRIKRVIDNGEQMSSKEIFEAAVAGDTFASVIVDTVTKYLGLACGYLGNILNPDAIVIGGGVSAAGDFLRQKIEDHFKNYSFPTVKTTTKIKLATLGNDAGIIGAASLALKFIK